MQTYCMYDLVEKSRKIASGDRAKHKTATTSILLIYVFFVFKFTFPCASFCQQKQGNHAWPCFWWEIAEIRKSIAKEQDISFLFYAWESHSCSKREKNFQFTLGYHILASFYEWTIFLYLWLLKRVIYSEFNFHQKCFIKQEEG